MGVRKKGRAKFSHSGREFVWWIDNVTYLRIASADKSLVTAYLIYDVPTDVSGIIAIHGPEFSGIPRSGHRPVWLVAPKSIADAFQNSMGAAVDAILTWCLDPEHEIVRYDRNMPSFLGIGRATEGSTGDGR